MRVFKSFPFLKILHFVVILTISSIFLYYSADVSAQCTQTAPACPSGYEPLIENPNFNSEGAGWSYWTDTGTTRLVRGGGEVGMRAANGSQRACWFRDYMPSNSSNPLHQDSIVGYDSLYFAANVWKNSNTTPGPYIALNRRFYYPKSSSTTDQVWCYNYGGNAPHSTGVFYYDIVNSCTTVERYIELNHPANALRANYCIWNTNSVRPQIEGYVNWMLLCGRRANKVNGSYSNYGVCGVNMSCGSTGTYQTRRCDSPRPDNGGNYCVEDVNTKYCYESTPDYLSDCCNVTENFECKACSITDTPTPTSTQTPTPSATDTPTPTVTVTPPVPCAVTMERPTAQRIGDSESLILLHWSMPSVPEGYNLLGYNLQFQNPSGTIRMMPFIPVGTTTFTHQTNVGLLEDDCGSYVYRIIPKITGCVVKWSAWSNSAESIIHNPSNVESKAQSCFPFRILTTWADNSSIEERYLVRRTPLFGGGTGILPANSTSFLDDTGLVTVSYTYSVQAVNEPRKCYSDVVSGNSVLCTEVPTVVTPTVTVAVIPSVPTLPAGGHPYCPR